MLRIINFVSSLIAGIGLLTLVVLLLVLSIGHIPHDSPLLWLSICGLLIVLPPLFMWNELLMPHLIASKFDFLCSNGSAITIMVGVVLLFFTGDKAFKVLCDRGDISAYYSEREVYGSGGGIYEWDEEMVTIDVKYSSSSGLLSFLLNWYGLVTCVVGFILFILTLTMSYAVLAIHKKIRDEPYEDNIRNTAEMKSKDN
ncbi:MAG: hypothetical protein SGI97_06640 [candidate division Zixibacteria bacterium]|nr:hypothetical protein [candidate division Zixibacteria bacterium]